MVAICRWVSCIACAHQKSSGFFALIWKAERGLGLILKIFKTTLDFLHLLKSVKNNTGSGTHKDKKTGFYWQQFNSNAIGQESWRFEVDLSVMSFFKFLPKMVSFNTWRDSTPVTLQSFRPRLLLRCAPPSEVNLSFDNRSYYDSNFSSLQIVWLVVCKSCNTV